MDASRVETGLWTFVARLGHDFKGRRNLPHIGHVSAYSLRSLNGLNGPQWANYSHPLKPGLGWAKKILAAPWPIVCTAPGGAYKGLGPYSRHLEAKL